MSYFYDTTETIPSGVGFSLFDSLHLVWLAIFAVVAVVSVIGYRKFGTDCRKRWRITVTALLVADEIFKVVMLIIGDRYLPGYLPLHLCSINIFLLF